MKLTIRTLRIEADIPGVTSVINHYESQPVTVDDVRSWCEDYSPLEYHTLRLVAEDESGVITGYSRMIHDLSLPDGYFRAWLCVDPACTGQGIGTALWDASLQYLRSEGATRVTSEVWDNDPASLRFAGQRGFTVEHHLFASSLDLTTFDETPYLPVIAGQEENGIRFCSLADFPDTTETRHKLWDLNETNELDVPNGPGIRTIFPEFEKFVFEAPWFRREGQILAVDGGDWVGLCAINIDPDAHSAYNLHTGVLRAYRGRKIGLALKVLAIRYARQNGAQRLITDNDSTNASILSINRKLGYRPLPGHFMLACRLDEK